MLGNAAFFVGFELLEPIWVIWMVVFQDSADSMDEEPRVVAGLGRSLDLGKDNDEECGDWAKEKRGEAPD